MEIEKSAKHIETNGHDFRVETDATLDILGVALDERAKYLPGRVSQNNRGAPIL